jgi:hypothetical protein
LSSVMMSGGCCSRCLVQAVRSICLSPCLSVRLYVVSVSSVALFSVPPTRTSLSLFLSLSLSLYLSLSLSISLSLSWSCRSLRPRAHAMSCRGAASRGCDSHRGGAGAVTAWAVHSCWLAFAPARVVALRSDVSHRCRSRRRRWRRGCPSGCATVHCLLVARWSSATAIQACSARRYCPLAHAQAAWAAAAAARLVLESETTASVDHSAGTLVAECTKSARRVCIVAL